MVVGSSRDVESAEQRMGQPWGRLRKEKQETRNIQELEAIATSKIVTPHRKHGSKHATMLVGNSYED